VYIDLSLIYERELSEEDKKGAALAREMLEELEKAGGFEDLGELPGVVRVVGLRRGTPEYESVFEGLPPEEKPRRLDTLSSLYPFHMGAGRSLSKANAARLHVAAERRDVAAFVAAFEQGLALARVYVHEPSLMGRLVGISMMQLAAERAQDALRGGWSDSALLDGLDSAMRRQLVWPSVRLVAEGARLEMFDVCRGAFDSRGEILREGREFVNSMVQFRQDVEVPSELAGRERTVKANIRLVISASNTPRSVLLSSLRDQRPSAK
jgi:hypothetical protein